MTKLLDEVIDGLPEIPTAALMLKLRPVISLSDQQFYELCRINDELRLERTAQGELVIMPPTGGRTGRRNLKLTQQIANWTDADRSGVAFDSSTVFKLPNSALRSPDVSWVRRERWEALTPEQQEGFSPLCPDFVIELRSPTDRLKKLQQKMEEYIANGAQLGWLIDPLEQNVYVYRQGAQVETLKSPPNISGEPQLPGLTLDLQEIW